MKIGPLLQSLKLGDDAAENDERLEQYFVATSTFADVVNDDADVVLGPKGSGKSAISRRLTSAAAAVPEMADVDVVPAFNLHGSVIFRRLASDLFQVDENLMRTAWLGYILALTGNRVVDAYPHNSKTASLKQGLAFAGLRDPGDQPKASWQTVLAALKRAVKSRENNSGFSFNPGNSAAVLTGISDYDEAADSSDTPLFDLEDLASSIIAVLESEGRRCWVVFDRLDEAFMHDRQLERVALRGLLRAYLDLANFGRTFRVKLFLRTDLLDRITRDEGFVNATHFRRQRITWDRKTLIDLVARRIYENEGLRKQFSYSPDNLQSEFGRLAICESVLPRSIESFEVFGWIVQRSTDATGEPNPRNVLRLLREARAKQLAICDRDNPDFASQGSLIGQRAMFEGLRVLSQTRLEDTLFAEFNNLRPRILELKGRGFEYRPSELARVFSLDVHSVEFNELVDGFLYSGLMRQSANGNLSVALLYRYALNMETGKRRGAKAVNLSASSTNVNSSVKRSSESNIEKSQRRRRRGGNKEPRSQVAKEGSDTTENSAPPASPNPLSGAAPPPSDERSYSVDSRRTRVRRRPNPSPDAVTSLKLGED